MKLVHKDIEKDGKGFVFNYINTFADDIVKLLSSI